MIVGRPCARKGVLLRKTSGARSACLRSWVLARWNALNQAMEKNSSTTSAGSAATSPYTFALMARTTAKAATRERATRHSTFIRQTETSYAATRAASVHWALRITCKLGVTHFSRLAVGCAAQKIFT